MNPEEVFKIENLTKRILELEEKLQAEKEKVEKLKKALEFVDYQFRTSFGDSDNMRESIKVARQILKEATNDTK